MKLHDVLLGDAAAESGARHLRKVDAVFAGDLADQRGGAGFFFVFVSGRGGFFGSAAGRQARCAG